MTLDEVRGILQQHRAELQTLGVRSLAVFGSVARGEAGPQSDVDLLAELASGAGYFELFRLEQRLTQLPGHRVHLFTPGSVHPRIRDRVRQEAVAA